LAAEAVVGGGELLVALLTSPVTLGAVALVAVSAVAARVLAARGRLPRRRGRVAPYLAAAAVVLLVGVSVFMVRPWASYGAVLEGSTLRVAFFDGEVVEVDVCGAGVELVSVEEAVDMLALRTLGVSEPVSGIRLGYYKLVDGRDARVIIWGERADKVLVVEWEGGVVMVGLPGVEELYQEILEVKARC